MAGLRFRTKSDSYILLALILRFAGPEEAKNLAGQCPPPDSGSFSNAEFGRNLASLSMQKPATPNRRFQFQKRRHLFIRTHNETLSVIAMRVSNPDCSPSRSSAEIQLRPARFQPLDALP
jgi:hypothetical protein